MRMRRPARSFGPAVLLMFLACLVPAAHAFAEQRDIAKGYRLAGTLAVGNDYLAFVEVPQGGQVLVRSGSVVNGVKVLAVTAHEARLSFPAGVVELLLDGTNRPIAPAASSAVLSKTDDVRNRVYNREISEEQVSRELAVTTGTKGAPAPGGGLVAAQRIAAVLDLPPGSQVLRVGPKPVTSAQSAIEQIDLAFESTAPVVILDIKTPKGPGRVYLHRDAH